MDFIEIIKSGKLNWIFYIVLIALLIYIFSWADGLIKYFLLIIVIGLIIILRLSLSRILKKTEELRSDGKKSVQDYNKKFLKQLLLQYAYVIFLGLIFIIDKFFMGSIIFNESNLILFFLIFFGLITYIGIIAIYTKKFIILMTLYEGDTARRWGIGLLTFGLVIILLLLYMYYTF
ncbi:MAG: hypothetical protein QF864_17490 [SAR202 cluster bacterium]|jgi:hypothetical protein|nr:hypothetical protein [SAR202 cluster bacterium]|tara:strand:- start:570 stop:1097 length:528 start_codon:yes stop_codon:yes gene_type:complete